MIPKIKENLSSYKPSGPIAGLPQAAVLILLHETSEDLNVIYCLRSNNLPTCLLYTSPSPRDLH